MCGGLSTAYWQIFDAQNTLSMPGKATRAVLCLVAGAVVPSHEAAGPSQSSASRRRHSSCSWSGRGGGHTCGGGPAVMTSRRGADRSKSLASIARSADVAPHTSSEDLLQYDTGTVLTNLLTTGRQAAERVCGCKQALEFTAASIQAALILYSAAPASVTSPLHIRVSQPSPPGQQQTSWRGASSLRIHGLTVQFCSNPHPNENLSDSTAAS